jgi:hypothetical protein
MARLPPVARKDLAPFRDRMANIMEGRIGARIPGLRDEPCGGSGRSIIVVQRVSGPTRRPLCSPRRPTHPSEEPGADDEQVRRGRRRVDGAHLERGAPSIGPSRRVHRIFVPPGRQGESRSVSTGFEIEGMPHPGDLKGNVGSHRRVAVEEIGRLSK